MRCRDSEAEKHFLFSNFVVALPHFLYVFSEMVWVSALMTAASAAAASAATSVKTSKIYTSNISLKRERNRSLHRMRTNRQTEIISSCNGTHAWQTFQAKHIHESEYIEMTIMVGNDDCWPGNW